MQSEQQDLDLQGHLPECECYGKDHGECALCICDRLRACEQRVRMEDDDYAYVAAQADADGRRRGWNDALDAVEAAVVEQKIVPLAKQRSFIITRNTKLWNDRQSWAEYGWWQFRQSAFAAIDALRVEQK